MASAKNNLFRQAEKALKTNDLGGWTRPTTRLYPHLWLWDSCFIAIGLAHLDLARAQEELRTIVNAQWENGMLPHVVFSDSADYHAGKETWQSWRHPAASTTRHTTAITQPPVLAEAVIRLAGYMSPDQRHAWLREMYQPLVDYHDWLYRERDPNAEGLVFQVHSWETGLDNTPPWMKAAHTFRPLQVRLADKLHLEAWLENRRKDTKQVPASERIRTDELYTAYRILKRLRACNYDIERIVASTVPLIIDLTFNSILIRANHHLQQIADELGETLPSTLAYSMQKAPAALQTLQFSNGEFFSRNFRTRKLIHEPSIATFMPLYSGAINHQQAAVLVDMLQDPKTYWLTYPVPSAPKTSAYFTPRRYWQGPTWVNTNWLIIDGLRRYGYDDLAHQLIEKTIAMVQQGGMYEYFSPLNGQGAGSEPFSWTAALTIDLLQEQQK